MTNWAIDLNQRVFLDLSEARYITMTHTAIGNLRTIKNNDESSQSLLHFLQNNGLIDLKASTKQYNNCETLL